MSELKSGDALDFTVGDKTFTVEPVPYGQIKKILKAMFDASKAISAGEVTTLYDLLDKNIFAIFPLLFKAGRYPWLDQPWIEEHMTVPVIKKILEAAMVVNGLQDFLGKAVTEKIRSNGTASTSPIQSENSGSTISAASVTDGVPKTLTN